MRGVGVFACCFSEVPVSVWCWQLGCDEGLVHTALNRWKIPHFFCALENASLFSIWLHFEQLQAKRTTKMQREIAKTSTQPQEEWSLQAKTRWASVLSVRKKNSSFGQKKRTSTVESSKSTKYAQICFRKFLKNAPPQIKREHQTGAPTKSRLIAQSWKTLPCIKKLFFSTPRVEFCHMKSSEIVRQIGWCTFH